MKNYYSVLGVKYSADFKQIKSAYVALIKKYHPDIFKGDKNLAQSKTAEINEAFDVLSDKTKKVQYDKLFFANNYEQKNTKNTKSNAKNKNTKNDDVPWYKSVFNELKKYYNNKKILRKQKRANKNNKQKNNKNIKAKNVYQQNEKQINLDLKKLNISIILVAILVVFLIVLTIIIK